MGENTKIEWADHTFNAWTGCTKVSPACDHCYAEAWAKRSGLVEWGAGEPRRRTTMANWQAPLRWQKAAVAQGKRPRVFCNSLSDVFDGEVPDAWRDDLMTLIAATPNLDWLLLTKRHKVMHDYMTLGRAQYAFNSTRLEPKQWPARNLWLGVTVENQEMADLRIPLLLMTPAAKRFLSCEPLLGRLNIAWALSRFWPEMAAGFHHRGVFSPGAETLRPLDWVITGGETGPGSRPTHPNWERALRDQCVAAGVPFFKKQTGDWQHDPRIIEAHGPSFIDLNGTWMQRVGKKRTGRDLDGRMWDEVPT